MMGGKLNPRAIVFDYDGTLADTMKLQELAWETAMNEIGVKNGDPQMKTIIENLYEGKARDGMFEGLELSPGDRVKARIAKDQTYREMRDRIELFPGVPETLAHLHTAYKLGLATTSAMEAVRPVLSKKGILTQFDAIVTGDEVRRLKPDPEMLEIIARRLSVSLQDVVVVGDSNADRKMAEAVGAMFILANFMGRAQVKRDLVSREVRHFSELCDIIE